MHCGGSLLGTKNYIEEPTKNSEIIVILKRYYLPIILYLGMIYFTIKKHLKSKNQFI